METIDVSNAGLLYLLASVILPIIVAFVTRQNTLGKYKAVILLALASVTSFVYQLHESVANNQDFDWKNGALTALVAFVIATGAHVGLWKPTEITGSEGVVQSKTPTIGL